MNKINYEIYDTINENIQISTLKEKLLQLHDICSDNMEIVNNSLWKTMAKKKYLECMTDIDKQATLLDECIKKLEKTVALIDEIKSIDNQIKNLQNQISAGLPQGQLQLNDLINTKNKKENELIGWWN